MTDYSLFATVLTKRYRVNVPSCDPALTRRKREKFRPGIYCRGISVHAHALPGNGGIRKHFVHCCIFQTTYPSANIVVNVVLDSYKGQVKFTW